MKNFAKIFAIVYLFALPNTAQSTVFTRTSPTGGLLPADVTEVGGVVLDLKGLNGNRVVSQLSAATMFSGFNVAEPQDIGTQTGFGGVLASLGGGLLGASVRITLFDGDSALGEFDYNKNTLLVDGISFGNFSSVLAQDTSADGLVLLYDGYGFANDLLSTGFFTLSDPAELSNLFTALGDDSVTYAVSDQSPGDNNLDFTQGVAGSLTNVGTSPVVTSAVPEPATWAMMMLGLGIVGYGLRRPRAYRATVACC